MSFGRLHADQEKAVKKVVRDRKVFDLGAGDMGLSMALAIMGAREVVAIDSKPREAAHLDVRVRPVDMSFDDWARRHPIVPLEVAFVSWPANYTDDKGLIELVSRADTIIYLGKCTDGTMCGSVSLFKHFLHRELLVYLPHQENTLCIYGRKLDTPRRGEYEERAGLDWERIWPYVEEETPERHATVPAGRSTRDYL